MNKKQVLVLNSGSSSIKFQLFKAEDENLQLILKGLIEGLGTAACFKAKVGTVNVSQELESKARHEESLQFLLSWLQAYLDDAVPLVVGHRVVHGGEVYRQPVVLDEAVIAKLAKLSPLAPLHQPHHIAAMEVLHRLNPELRQVACFDTAFHAEHQREVWQFALPRAITEEGVRRYGFHGLSYEFIAKELKRVDPELASGKVVAAHLGNGSSLCAMADGVSVDSSMGFSALEGLMMGTRTGSIDAGVLLYLLQEKQLDAKQLSDLLYKQSGLLGVSGISNDMRLLLESEQPEAEEAVSLFVHRIARETGALTSVLKGLDGLVFTAGIGERSAPIRARVCEKLAWMGIKLDAELNAQPIDKALKVSAQDSDISVYVIPTNEELMIAQHTIALV